MDAELRERFAALEAQMGAQTNQIMMLLPKVDSVLQAQITLAAVQEHTRNQTEKLTSLVAHIEEHNRRLSGVESKINGMKHWVAGSMMVMTLFVIPSYAFLYKESKEQIALIDRRLSNVEIEIQRTRMTR